VQKYFGGGLKAQQEMIDNAREKLNEAYNTRDEFLAEYGGALEDAWDQAQPQIKQPQAKQTQLKPQARRPVSTPSLSDTELNAITDKVDTELNAITDKVRGTSDTSDPEWERVDGEWRKIQPATAAKVAGGQPQATEPALTPTVNDTLVDSGQRTETASSGWILPPDDPTGELAEIWSVATDDADLEDERRRRIPAGTWQEENILPGYPMNTLQM